MTIIDEVNDSTVPSVRDVRVACIPHPDAAADADGGTGWIINSP